MRCHVIHGGNADLLIGFNYIEASVCSCALLNIEMSLLFMWIGSWYPLCLWMPWPGKCQVIHRHNAAHPAGCLSIRVSVIHVFRKNCISWCTGPMRGQAIHLHRANHLSECFYQGFNIHTYSVCFMHIYVIFTVPVDVLAPWLPGHPQTLCGCYNIHTYSDEHCSCCFKYTNVILIVPVDVLPPELSGLP